MRVLYKNFKIKMCQESEKIEIQLGFNSLKVTQMLLPLTHMDPWQRSCTAWRFQLTPISFSLACKPKVIIYHYRLCLSLNQVTELNFQAADLMLLKCPDVHGGLRWSPGGSFATHCFISRPGPVVEDQCTSPEQLYQPSRQSQVPATPWCSNHSLNKIDKSFSHSLLPSCSECRSFRLSLGTRSARKLHRIALKQNREKIMKVVCLNIIVYNLTS